MLLHTDNLPSGYQVEASMDYLLFDDEKLFVVSSDNDLIFIKKSPSPYKNRQDEPGILLYQTEFPRIAATWLINAIENRLWRSAAEGGEPSGKNSVTEVVEGEELSVRRVMAVGDDRSKGFVLINASRDNLKFREDFQEIQVSDRLLKEGGLLNVLRQL
ncbi:hypothetical protein VT06_09120 [Arsukibacterium sp. MJ3]|uniref:hypothetical protein n=1 Tax=Arsukibacterium sp. MJ3 TaxID=1632859 RepID=UPI00062703E3|nr:hypothetical protein [Arsukibacterium sp. MJ3]KKO48895.1 hypothetical protein VT06_09120 [Arsukibacterium sp. MJ3]